jgi:hypothetical protein
MVARMAHHRVIVNRLPVLLPRLGVSWAELSRRTLLPGRLLARLRAPDANPRLTVAERIASALDVPIERVWRLP